VSLSAEANDLADANAAIRTLVSLLPDLRVVVLMGNAAQRGWVRRASASTSRR
jgi:hypothetical protein